MKELLALLAALTMSASPAAAQTPSMAYYEPSSSETSSSDEGIAGSDVLGWTINDASVYYREKADGEYATGDASKGGVYYLSAEGWSEGDDFDIALTTKGFIATMMEGKTLTLLEYKVDTVVFAGSVVQKTEGVYRLAKPAEKGAYDLSIYFTAESVTSWDELAGLNWKSLFTVNNLMTILAWVLLMAGIFAFYFLSRKYKKQGSTTLEDAEKAFSSKMEALVGTELSEKLTSVLDGVVKKSYNALTDEVGKVDENMKTLMQCFLVMQENTPEARLAVAEKLSKLQEVESGLNSEVRGMIESEIAKIKEAALAKQSALDDAKAIAQKYLGVSEKDIGDIAAMAKDRIESKVEEKIAAKADDSLPTE